MDGSVGRALPLVLVASACGGATGQVTPVKQGGEARERERMEAGDAAASMRPPSVWESAAELEAWCARALAGAGVAKRELYAHMAGGDAPAEATVLEPFHRMLVSLDDAEGWASLLFSVHPDEAVRQAAQSCQEKVAAFKSDVNLDRTLYEAFAGLPLDGLDEHTRRFASKQLEAFELSGVDKDEATRTRLGEIDEEIVRLGQRYGKNIREDVRELVLDGPEALAGLPEDYIAAHPPGPDGKIHITTDYPDFFPIQSYSPDAKLRRDLYALFGARAWPKNQKLLARLLELRAEYASIIGYPTWASYHAVDKMVGSADVVRTFIADVARSARPRMERDLAAVLEAKRKDDPEAKRVEVWDRFYYVGKVREARFDFDSREVRPYFPFEAVLQGILDLYGELFELRFERDDGAPVWHPSVSAWVMFKGEERLGRFYLDMHPREGKYKHAAMFPILTGTSGERDPMASLVCNLPDPSDGDGKALLEHSDVVTFFHEFGHLIHHLLSRGARWIPLTGIHVEWDFVEAPSQILEEWAWDPAVLARFARHVETGEPIAAETVARMREAEEFGKGVHVMRQVFYAAFSFLLHDREAKGLDLDAFTDEIYRDYSPYPRVPGGKVFANFGHLVGYSSMYYTYQWSLAIAKDLFTRFESAPGGLLDRETAQAYRDWILVPGGTVDPDTLVEGFLGRPRNLEAYKAWLERE